MAGGFGILRELVLTEGLNIPIKDEVPDHVHAIDTKSHYLH